MNQLNKLKFFFFFSLLSDSRCYLWIDVLPERKIMLITHTKLLKLLVKLLAKLLANYLQCKFIVRKENEKEKQNSNLMIFYFLHIG